MTKGMHRSKRQGDKVVVVKVAALKMCHYWSWLVWRLEEGAADQEAKDWYPWEGRVRIAYNACIPQGSGDGVLGHNYMNDISQVMASYVHPNGLVGNNCTEKINTAHSENIKLSRQMIDDGSWIASGHPLCNERIVMIAQLRCLGLTGMDI